MRSARASPTTPVETPHDYHDLIERMRARALPMICANPDVVVERGDKLVYCAGAIADLYAAAGGDVTYAGKPYRPIYEQALAIAEAARARPVERHRVLAIGDPCAPTSRAPRPSGSIACSSPRASTPRSSAPAIIPTRRRCRTFSRPRASFPKAVMRRLNW